MVTRDWRNAPVVDRHAVVRARTRDPLYFAWANLDGDGGGPTSPAVSYEKALDFMYADMEKVER